MPLEINDLVLSARMSPENPGDGRLSDREVERIARRVIALLKDEAESARMARTEGSALSILGEM